jgi:hypothetical protein
LPLVIPPILLEGDEPSPVARAGSLEGGPPVAARPLPSAYGTGVLRLIGRDPHWLYAHWDYSPEQQQQFNSLSEHHHLVIRLYQNERAGAPMNEVHVHPESHHWFIHAPGADLRYLAELGYYGVSHEWVSLAISLPALTPPEGISADTSARFATIPISAPLPRRVELSERVRMVEAGRREPVAASPGVVESVGGQKPLVSMSPRMEAGASSPRTSPPVVDRGSLRERRVQESDVRVVRRIPSPAQGLPQPPVRPDASSIPHSALRTPHSPWSPEFPPELRPEGFPIVVASEPGPGDAVYLLPESQEEAVAPEWTREEELIVAEMSGMTEEWTESIGSAEIARLLSREAKESVLRSQGPSQESSAGPETSSPMGGEPPAAPGFWLNVNAELVIYGSTEPNARVTIAGQPVLVRPDGTFSCRYALPDGHYHLPIQAESVLGDGRRAKLEFFRGTEHSGEVGAAAQDAGLKAPAA